MILHAKRCFFALCALILVFGMLGLAYALNIHRFLAPVKPIKAQILIVEGWIPSHALMEVAKHLEFNEYDLIITTGIPIERGTFLSHFKSYADLASENLMRIIENKMIIAVPAPNAMKDRTYISALTVRHWLQKKNNAMNTVNWVSYGVHGRRSWFLAKKAFGNDYSIGIISIDDNRYDEKKWWSYSSGFKMVVSETIAFAYSLLFSEFASDLS